MARIDRDAIESFVSITGATEAVALQKLEVYGGDLNAAVNAYYIDKDTDTTFHYNSHDNIINAEEPMDIDLQRSTFSDRTMQGMAHPFSIFNSFLSGRLLGERSTFFSGSAPQVSHPREVREIPIDFKDDRSHLEHSMPIIEDITGIASENVPEIQGTVVFDDEDDEDAVRPSPKGEKKNYDVNITKPGTSDHTSDNTSYSIYDIEEEMFRAAINASKLEVGRHADHHIADSHELGRVLSAKQASLPPEPEIDDDNAITILIRLPDGSRCGRRFLKFEKMQLLFDFIDVGRVVAPGTYRLVRTFPKRVFGKAESDISLNELGLTSKQELLFVELI